MFGHMKLLDRVRDVGLRRRLARSTIACYQSWISEYLRFSRVAPGRWRPPEELGAGDVAEGSLAPAGNTVLKRTD
jgi:hypothetical protein